MPATTPQPAPESRPAPRDPAAGPSGLLFDDPLSTPSSDDTDRGWGERPHGGSGDGDLARFLDEKPPHHL